MHGRAARLMAPAAAKAFIRHAKTGRRRQPVLSAQPDFLFQLLGDLVESGLNARFVLLAARRADAPQHR
jgi:hypothetical protein